MKLNNKKYFRQAYSWKNSQGIFWSQVKRFILLVWTILLFILYLIT